MQSPSPSRGSSRTSRPRAQERLPRTDRSFVDRLARHRRGRRAQRRSRPRLRLAGHLALRQARHQIRTRRHNRSCRRLARQVRPGSHHTRRRRGRARGWRLRRRRSRRHHVARRSRPRRGLRTLNGGSRWKRLPRSRNDLPWSWSGQRSGSHCRRWPRRLLRRSRGGRFRRGSATPARQWRTQRMRRGPRAHHFFRGQTRGERWAGLWFRLFPRRCKLLDARRGAGRFRLGNGYLGPGRFGRRGRFWRRLGLRRLPTHAKMPADPVRNVLVNRARVRLLLGNPELRQDCDNLAVRLLALPR
jgi:hypothetical protein